MVSERRVVCWRDVLKLMYTPGLPEARLSDTVHSTTFILSETLKYLKPAKINSKNSGCPTADGFSMFFAIPFWYNPLVWSQGKKLILRPRLFEIVAGPEEVLPTDPALSKGSLVDGCQAGASQVVVFMRQMKHFVILEPWKNAMNWQRPFGFRASPDQPIRQESTRWPDKGEVRGLPAYRLIGADRFEPAMPVCWKNGVDRISEPWKMEGVILSLWVFKSRDMTICEHISSNGKKMENGITIKRRYQKGFFLVDYSRFGLKCLVRMWHTCAWMTSWCGSRVHLPLLGPLKWRPFVKLWTVWWKLPHANSRWCELGKNETVSNMVRGLADFICFICFQWFAAVLFVREESPCPTRWGTPWSIWKP